MTQAQRTELDKAISRATAEHITLAAQGIVKASGERFFIVNGKHGQYVVTVGAERLSCTCPAGKVGKLCKHRGLCHELLRRELQASARQVAAAEVATTAPAAAAPTTQRERRETSGLHRSNAPVSIWK